MAKGELKKNQGLNSGIPKERGQSEETKKQLQSRLDRSGKGRARGGMRTLQNLAGGTVTSEKSQQLSEEAKIEDVEAGEKQHKAKNDDVTVVQS